MNTLPKTIRESTSFGLTSLNIELTHAFLSVRLAIRTRSAIAAL